MNHSNTIPSQHTHQKRRILFISLEFTYSPFSGNGVLARSLISGLLRRTNEEIELRVICGRPHPSTNDLVSSNDVSLEKCDNTNNRLEIWPVDLPRECLWKRLDRYGPWKEFVQGCTCTTSYEYNDNADYSRRVQEFEPMEVLAIDWHGMLVWNELCNILWKDGNGKDVVHHPNNNSRSWCPSGVRVCYYNFRVYSASLWDHPQTSSSSETIHASDDENDEQFYIQKEQLSCRLADLILCLSEHDRQCLQHLIKQDTLLSSEEITMKANSIQILPPPLRGDILELASRDDSSELISHLPAEAQTAIQQLSQYTSLFDTATIRMPSRIFITCMVRLSPEKTPHHFVSFLKKLGGIQFLKSARLIPLICGAKSVHPSYAQSVLHDFVSLCSSEPSHPWPYVVIDRFLGPKEMAAVFSCSAINLHPCLYDAYGMTVVESAAFGAVSIVNKGGRIGATSLLREGVGCVGVDMDGFGEEENNDTLLLDCMEQIKNHRVSFERIREIGRSLAIGWHEEVYCSSLLSVLSNIDRLSSNDVF